MPSSTHTDSVRRRTKRPSTSRGYTFSSATYSDCPLPCSGMRTSFIAAATVRQLPADRGGDQAHQPEEEKPDAVDVQARAPPLGWLALAQRHRVDERETQHGAERGGQECAPDDGARAARTAPEFMFRAGIG